MPGSEQLSLKLRLRPARKMCDRCDEKVATRFGVAQVAGDRGVRWQDVGLCDRCAAYCAAPGGSPGSSLAAEHSIVW